MVHIEMFVTLSLLSLVHGEPPVNTYGYQPIHHSNKYNTDNSFLTPKTGFALPNSYLPPNSFTGAHNHGNGHDNNNYDHENEVPKSYEFGYSVKDARSGNDYGRRESSDGHVVRGEYRVQLPDGRTQIVTYHADWRTGFHADVRYEGEATYPEQNRQGYNYNIPDYSGSLTGFHDNRQYNKRTTSYGPPAV